MVTVIDPRPGDGRISREDAALLADVLPDTISAWISRGKLKDVRREGKRVWLNVVEVIEVEDVLHKREKERDARRRARMELITGSRDPEEAVA